MWKKTALNKSKLNKENRVISLNKDLTLKDKKNVVNKIHCNTWHDNLSEDISEEEIKKIINSLESYSIDVPKSEERLKTIEAVKFYMPKSKRKKFKEDFESFINYLEFEISYINKYYFLLCLIFILIGIVATGVFNYDYSLSLMALSPLPIILGIFEVFKGRDCGAFELELTLKYSVKKVLGARFMFISIFSILINFLLSIVIWSLSPSINLFRLSVLWLTPLSVIGALTLIIVSRLKGYIGTLVSLSLWTGFLLSMKVDWVQKYFLNLSLGYCITLIVLSAILTICVISNYLKNHIQNQCFHEGMS